MDRRARGEGMYGVGVGGERRRGGVGVLTLVWVRVGVVIVGRDTGAGDEGQSVVGRISTSGVFISGNGVSLLPSIVNTRIFRINIFIK